MQYTDMAAVTIHIALTCSPRLTAKVVKEARPTKTTMPYIRNVFSDFMVESLEYIKLSTKGLNDDTGQTTATQCLYVGRLKMVV